MPTLSSSRATLTPEAAVDLLRGHRLRVTRQRVTVLTVLSGGGHLRADEVRRAVVEARGAVSVQAIYDVLTTLNTSGLINKIEPAGSPAQYEFRIGDNHHHLVCRSCGHVEDVDCALGESPCLTPSETAGFTVDQAEVTYWGLCPACQRLAPDHEGAAYDEMPGRRRAP